MKDFGKKEITGIGILYPQNDENMGTLWRSALIFEVDFIFMIGKKFIRQSSDVYETYKSVPCFFYRDFEDFYTHLPYNCRLVGVEIHETARQIEEYRHFAHCVYVLGSEHTGLSEQVLAKCHEIIQLPKGNYNVAMAGTIVLYDRYFKKQFSSLSHEN